MGWGQLQFYAVLAPYVRILLPLSSEIDKRLVSLDIF